MKRLARSVGQPHGSTNPTSTRHTKWRILDVPPSQLRETCHTTHLAPLALDTRAQQARAHHPRLRGGEADPVRRRRAVASSPSGSRQSRSPAGGGPLPPPPLLGLVVHWGLVKGSCQPPFLDPPIGPNPAQACLCGAARVRYTSGYGLSMKLPIILGPAGSGLVGMHLRRDRPDSQKTILPVLKHLLSSSNSEKLQPRLPRSSVEGLSQRTGGGRRTSHDYLEPNQKRPGACEKKRQCCIRGPSKIIA